MEKGSTNMFIISIIAIVAIVGMMIIFLGQKTVVIQGTPINSISENQGDNENLGGQATFRSTRNLVPISIKPVNSVVDRVIIWNEGYNLMAEFFDSNGEAINSEFSIDGATTESVVKVCSDGSSIFAWIQQGTNLPMAQFFDKYGINIGSEFTLNGIPSSEIMVDCSENNKVISWLEGNVLMTQFFDSEGINFNQEFAITGAAINPSISVCNDGTTIFGWETADLPMAQFFDNQGSHLGVEFNLNGIPINDISVSCK